MSHRPRGLVPGAFAALVLASCSTAPASSDQPPRAASPSPSAGAAAPPTAAAAGPTSVGSFDAAHAAQVLDPSVGLVIATGASGSRSSGDEGSAFVIRAQNGTSYLLTNNHVVQGARRIQVLMPDGRHYTVDVQGTDAIEDVAVLKVSDTLPVAQLADSTKLQVGEPVVTIGNPQGSSGFDSVTVGVISALHRQLTGVSGGAGTQPENLNDVLQTDAPISPGNSGGPLADGNGHVVGMITAGNTNANGIGYAIPSAVLQRVIPSLVQGKEPGHPYVGICFRAIEDALATSPDVQGYGVVVDRALPGTPAEKAGIQTGDVIEKIGGVSLNDGQTLGGVLQVHNPGDTVQVTALRNGGAVNMSLTVADRPADGGPAC